MKDVNLLKESLLNKVKPWNLSAAISTQTNLGAGNGSISSSPQFLNQEFRESGFNFNIHLHAVCQDEYDQPSVNTSMSPPRWSATISAYIKRKDIGILVVHGNSSDPASPFGLKKDDAPQVVIKKLLSILHERYLEFDDYTRSGMIIVPTGSLTGFAARLEKQVLELAGLQKLEMEFLNWLRSTNIYGDTYTGVFPVAAVSKTGIFGKSFFNGSNYFNIRYFEHPSPGFIRVSHYSFTFRNRKNAKQLPAALYGT